MKRESIIRVYPTTRRMSQSLDALLAVDHDSALMVGDHMTFGQFENRLIEEVLGPVNTISDTGRRLLISSILQKRAIHRNFLNNADHTRGFLSALISLFDELGAGLVTPDELSQIKNYSEAKEGELYYLFNEYRKILESLNIVDVGQLRYLLVEKLGNKESLRQIRFLDRFREIHLIDIYQFTPYRFELLRLLGLHKKLTIHTPVPDSRRKAFGFLVKNMEKFESLAGAEGLLEILPGERYESKLDWLKNSLFSVPSSSKPSPDEKDRSLLKIVECVSRYREIEEVASSIYWRKESEQSSWRDFALVLRDFNPYGPIITDVFNRYGIPYQARHGTPLILSPLARSVCALFEAIDRNFEKDIVARIVSSPYFLRFRKFGVDDARRLYLEAGIIDGDYSKWKKFLERVARDNQLANETLSLIEKLTNLQKKKRPKDFIAALKELFSWLSLTGEPESSKDIPHNVIFRDSESFKKLNDVIDELVTGASNLNLSNISLGFDKLRDTFYSAISSVELKDEPTGVNNNYVSVITVHDIIGADFKHIYVSGLHENEFPQSTKTGALLNEEEQESFNIAHAKNVVKNDPRFFRGRKIFERAYDKWREESLLFFQTVAAASENLMVTYSSRELNDTPLNRSQFIDDLLDVVAPGSDNENREEFISKSNSLAVANQWRKLIDPEERRARLILDIFRPSSDDREGAQERVAEVSGDDEAWARFVTLLRLTDMERSRDASFFSNDRTMKKELAGAYGGVIENSANLLERVAVKNYGRYAPTDLEKYGQCPFRYYASKPLGLKPVDEPRKELDAKETGTLIHEILENFYSERIKNKKGAITGTQNEIESIKAAIKKVGDYLIEKGEAGDPAIFSVELKRLLSQLARWLKHEKKDQQAGGYVPAGVEVSFELGLYGKERGRDTEDFVKPLLFSLPCGADRYLVGVADRIDVSNDKKSLRVVDYKNSSNRTHYLSMVKPENVAVTSFQLGAYMALGENWAKENEIEIERYSGCYALLRSKTSQNPYVTLNEMATDEFMATVSQVVEKIEGGDFLIDPINCDYCDFPGLCRFVEAPFQEQDE